MKEEIIETHGDGYEDEDGDRYCMQHVRPSLEVRRMLKYFTSSGRRTRFSDVCEDQSLVGCISLHSSSARIHPSEHRNFVSRAYNQVPYLDILPSLLQCPAEVPEIGRRIRLREPTMCRQWPQHWQGKQKTLSLRRPG